MLVGEQPGNDEDLAGKQAGAAGDRVTGGGSRAISA
jgi:hypothetical protein